ncbi:MAG: OmpH family outer membrane protein [Flavobacteriaceae bacterium]|nr:OmpH family outer membrane protein [Flavobacteriaceae bacterium]
MKFFKILFLFICVSGFAQHKVGTIDIDYILSQMPGLPAAQAQVETYGTELEGDLKAKMDLYNTLIKSYQESEATLSEADRTLKQQEIVTAEEDIKKFQQNGAQLINLKRDEVLAPMYQKIGDSLEKIAKAEGYAQVLQINNNIVYISEENDLTLAVLKDLGIEVKTN